MFSSVTSGALFGVSSYLVQVEVDITQGLPGFALVGVPGSEVREAAERVRVAIRNSGIRIPPIHITVNLSPAGLRKEGTAFDLPIAVGILMSLGHLQTKEEKLLFVGELGLAGEVKGVKGVLPIVMKAREEGCKVCIIPKANEAEGLVVDDIQVIGVETLKEVIEGLKSGFQKQKQDRECKGYDFDKAVEQEADFADVHGQKTAKRAAEVAAAGFHNLLLSGPPGSGKTMIASRIPSILPPMTKEEILEMTAIYSVAGRLNQGGTLLTRRPFIQPHHTVTEKAMAGGGRNPKPGLISLAHRGVLFLDELPEFKKPVIEILRQPLEDKKICIARNNGSYQFPSDFMLLGSMNPCPCGYFPDLSRCRCSPAQRKRYSAKVSGPILDRMDMGVELLAVSPKEIMERASSESSAAVRARVQRARRMQEERYRGSKNRFNADLGSEEIRIFCILGNKEKEFAQKVLTLTGMSARGYYKMLKVARTIADLSEEEEISEVHLAEAAAYRSMSCFLSPKEGDKMNEG